MTWKKAEKSVTTHQTRISISTHQHKQAGFFFNNNNHSTRQEQNIMGSPQEGPNPLRPYYIPPSIGLPPPSSSHAQNAATSVSHSAKASFGNSARDLLTELDYSDYLSESSPSISGSAKDLLDRAIWKYSSVLMAQPFEAAKTILQAYVVQGDEQEGQIVPEERRRQSQGFGGNNYYDEVPLPHTQLALLY